jgi:hypothetical protein
MSKRHVAILGLTALSLCAALRSFAADKSVDVLEMTDGTRLVGVITRQSAGQYIVLVTAAGEQHMVPWQRIKSGATPPATASTDASPSASASASAPRRAVVVLKDRTKVEGALVRQEPGQFVIIALADGTERTIPWERVSEVNITSGAAPTTPPAPAAKPTATPRPMPSAAPSAAPSSRGALDHP